MAESVPGGTKALCFYLALSQIGAVEEAGRERRLKVRYWSKFDVNLKTFSGRPEQDSEGIIIFMTAIVLMAPIWPVDANLEYVLCGLIIVILVIVVVYSETSSTTPSHAPD